MRPAAVAATSAALLLSGAAASASTALPGSEFRQTPSGTVKANVRPAPRGACGSPRTPASYPVGFMPFKGRTFFAADDGVHGYQQWRTDGSPAGTLMVTDIGDARDGYAGVSYVPVASGNTLFFTADDGVHGDELWKSDGTRGGAVMVKDIKRSAGYDDYGPSNLTAVGNTLFFVADDGRHGRELWRSDGTSAGTVMVKDIGTSEDDYAPAPTALTAVGNTLFFKADDGVHGAELWKSDGTRAGTVMVEDITPDGVESYYQGPYDLADIGGTLFFTTEDGVHGRELWRSDGSPAGTAMVKDIRPGSYDSAATDFLAVGDTLFFTARDGVHGRELWTSDGTEAGTALVKDLNGDARASGATSLTRVGTTVFFSADDGDGTALWKSDGTEVGTTKVSEVAPVDTGYGAEMEGVGATLFFVAADDVHGPELWKSDGTEAGTVLVRDITPGASDGYYDIGPLELTGVGGALYFAADDGVHGWEPWRSDGTEAGTTEVRDINLGGGFALPSRGSANTRTGELSLRVDVEGAGHLVAGPAGEQLIRTTREHLRKAGRARVTLTPNAAGMRKLRHALRVAHRHGKDVGRIRVGARFTFTPCGGGPSSQTRRYTLTLR